MTEPYASNVHARPAVTTHGHPQQPSGMPVHRYPAFPPIGLTDRTWPERTSL